MLANFQITDEHLSKSRRSSGELEFRQNSNDEFNNSNVPIIEIRGAQKIADNVMISLNYSTRMGL